MQVVKSVYVLQKFAFGNAKKFIFASTFATVVKLLPFLPPVVLVIKRTLLDKSTSW